MANDPIFGSNPVIYIAKVTLGSPGTPSSAWLWGDDTSGNIGDNDIHSAVLIPTSPAGNHSFTILSIASGYAAGLKVDGTVWGWGNCSNGVGDNTTTVRSSPVSMVGAHSFVDVSLGSINPNFCLKADGTIWSWGINNNGHLGDNTTAPKSSPVSVVGAHSFVQLFGLNTGGIGLKSDGTVWSWGASQAGNIGDNTTNTRSSPVSVVGAHSFVQVSGSKKTGSGAGASFALKSDGTCWSWGSGTNGQLGSNTTADRSSPVSVVGAHSFVYITSMHGLKSDGTCWGWGDNTVGSVGDGTVTNRSSPVSVVGAHSFVKISSSTTLAMGLKLDGSCWSWGDNSILGLCDGTTISRSSPVSIPNFKFSTLAGVAASVGGAIGYGPMKLLCSGGANGTRIDSIVIQATGQTTSGYVRVFVNPISGAFNPYLYKEIVIPASTRYNTTIPLNITLSSSMSIYVSSNNTEPMNVFAIGNDY